MEKESGYRNMSKARLLLLSRSMGAFRCSTKWPPNVLNPSKALQEMTRSLLLTSYILTQWLQRHCFLTVAAGTEALGWLRLNFHTRVFKKLESTFIWIICWLIAMITSLTFSPGFNLRARGVFQGSGANHKNLSRFYSVSFTFSNELSSSAL